MIYQNARSFYWPEVLSMVAPGPILLTTLEKLVSELKDKVKQEGYEVSDKWIDVRLSVEYITEEDE